MTGTVQYNRDCMRSCRAAARCCFPVLFASVLLAQTAQNPVQAELPPGLYAEIDATMGRITCRLLPSEAPKTVENFVALATGKKAWTDPRDQKEKHTPFYTGLTFHRVIKNFMIQAGDPLGTGEGGPGFSIDDEVSPNLHFDKPGKLAMAKRSFPNSAGSQFFITTAPAPWLEGKYAIFGEVVEGQDVADKISQLATGEDDKPTAPVTIQTIVIRRVRPPDSAKTTRSK
jgi:peptidyl-prolyl cis-trans isomerase A (cyclophilin A)